MNMNSLLLNNQTSLVAPSFNIQSKNYADSDGSIKELSRIFYLVSNENYVVVMLALKYY